MPIPTHIDGVPVSDTLRDALKEYAGVFRDLPDPEKLKFGRLDLNRLTDNDLELYALKLAEVLKFPSKERRANYLDRCLTALQSLRQSQAYRVLESLSSLADGPDALSGRMILIKQDLVDILRCFHLGIVADMIPVCLRKKYGPRLHPNVLNLTRFSLLPKHFSDICFTGRAKDQKNKVFLSDPEFYYISPSFIASKPAKKEIDAKLKEIENCQAFDWVTYAGRMKFLDKLRDDIQDTLAGKVSHHVQSDQATSNEDDAPTSAVNNETPTAAEEGPAETPSKPEPASVRTASPTPPTPSQRPKGTSAPSQTVRVYGGGDPRTAAPAWVLDEVRTILLMMPHLGLPIDGFVTLMDVVYGKRLIPGEVTVSSVTQALKGARDFFVARNKVFMIYDQDAHDDVAVSVLKNHTNLAQNSYRERRNVVESDIVALLKDYPAGVPLSIVKARVGKRFKLTIEETLNKLGVTEYGSLLPHSWHVEEGLCLDGEKTSVGVQEVLDKEVSNILEDYKKKTLVEVVRATRRAQFDAATVPDRRVMVSNDITNLLKRQEDRQMKLVDLEAEVSSRFRMPLPGAEGDKEDDMIRLAPACAASSFSELLPGNCRLDMGVVELLAGSDAIKRPGRDSRAKSRDRSADSKSKENKSDEKGRSDSKTKDGRTDRRAGARRLHSPFRRGGGPGRRHSPVRRGGSADRRSRRTPPGRRWSREGQLHRDRQPPRRSPPRRRESPSRRRESPTRRRESPPRRRASAERATTDQGRGPIRTDTRNLSPIRSDMKEIRDAREVSRQMASAKQRQTQSSAEAAPLRSARGRSSDRDGARPLGDYPRLREASDRDAYLNQDRALGEGRNRSPPARINEVRPHVSETFAQRRGLASPTLEELGLGTVSDSALAQEMVAAARALSAERRASPQLDRPRSRSRSRSARRRSLERKQIEMLKLVVQRKEPQQPREEPSRPGDRNSREEHMIRMSPGRRSPQGMPAYRASRSPLRDRARGEAGDVYSIPRRRVSRSPRREESRYSQRDTADASRMQLQRPDYSRERSPERRGVGGVSERIREDDRRRGGSREGRGERRVDEFGREIRDRPRSPEPQRDRERRGSRDGTGASGDARDDVYRLQRMADDEMRRVEEDARQAREEEKRRRRDAEDEEQRRRYREEQERRAYRERSPYTADRSRDAWGRPPPDDARYRDEAYRDGRYERDRDDRDRRDYDRYPPPAADRPPPTADRPLPPAAGDRPYPATADRAPASAAHPDDRVPISARPPVAAYPAHPVPPAHIPPFPAVYPPYGPRPPVPPPFPGAPFPAPWPPRPAPMVPPFMAAPYPAVPPPVGDVPRDAEGRPVPEAYALKVQPDAEVYRRKRPEQQAVPTDEVYRRGGAKPPEPDVYHRGQAKDVAEAGASKTQLTSTQLDTVLSVIGQTIGMQAAGSQLKQSNFADLELAAARQLIKDRPKALAHLRRVPSKFLLISGMTTEIRAARLHSTCSAYGQVSYVKILDEAATKTVCAIVAMGDVEQASRCVQALHGFKMEGVILAVEMIERDPTIQ